jgi:hypothetical protein
MPAASVACAGMGNLSYEWNELEEAERFLNEAIELGQRVAFGSLFAVQKQGVFFGFDFAQLPVYLETSLRFDR